MTYTHGKLPLSQGVSPTAQQTPQYTPAGYDPELLFVECGRCGRPVLWEPGQATKLLKTAYIDPLELDAHCLLITDGCPQCSPGTVFNVQVSRVQRYQGLQKDIQDHGNA